MNSNVKENTDIVMVPDNYYPSLDVQGNYIDNLVPFNFKSKGITCLCGARRDKVYLTYSTFSSHCKTTTHQKWLTNMNLNKANYYVENMKLNELVQNQRLIMAKLENDLHNKNMTIDYLTQQLINKKSEQNVQNLLEFD
jgi:hypothetical protein